MINDKSYIHIWGWMLNELNLKWSELIIYATIFSFTNWTDDHCFHWSAEYLSERAWVSRRQTLNSLKRLVEKWLISRKEREINWVKFIDYYATGCLKIRQDEWRNFTGSEKISDRVWKNFRSYNSIYNSNKYIDKSIYLEQEEKKDKNEYKIYWEFKRIKLTDEQYEKLRREIWGKFRDIIEECDRWLELNPRKKYKNYYAFIKNWYKKNQKWIQDQVEVKQKLYANKWNKYIKQNNSIGKQNQQQKFQQFLDNNKQYNGQSKDSTVNRRTEIWGDSLFWE